MPKFLPPPRALAERPPTTEPPVLVGPGSLPTEGELEAVHGELNEAVARNADPERRQWLTLTALGLVEGPAAPADAKAESRRRGGFAAMAPERRREVSSKGGLAARDRGVAHRWTSEAARAAGRKGGHAGAGRKAGAP